MLESQNKGLGFGHLTIRFGWEITDRMFNWRHAVGPVATAAVTPRRFAVFRTPVREAAPSEPYRSQSSEDRQWQRIVLVADEPPVLFPLG